MTSRNIQKLNAVLTACDDAVERLNAKRATAARHHTEAVAHVTSTHAAAISAATAKRDADLAALDRDLAALDRELADARAAAGQAFDALLAARASQSDPKTAHEKGQ